MGNTKRAVGILVVAGLVAGCGGPAAIATPATSAAAPSPTAAQEASPAAVVTATSSPTATPATNEVTPEPMPAESLSAAKLRQYVRACSDGSAYVSAVVIATVKNDGNTWVELFPSESDYTVFDADGGVTTTGSFTYAYPTYLAPGQVGYLADDPVVDGAKASDFKTVEVDGGYDAVDESEVIVLTASKVKVRKESYGQAHIATGIVTNESTLDVDSAHAAAFFLNEKGDPIGFSYTNLIENVRAGKSKGFETIGDSCPPKWSSVAKTVVLIGN